MGWHLAVDEMGGLAVIVNKKEEKGTGGGVKGRGLGMEVGQKNLCKQVIVTQNLDFVHIYNGF